MKFYSAFFLIYSFTVSVFASTDKDTIRICYFSLNNEKEFPTTQKLIQKVNEVNTASSNTNVYIDIQEQMNPTGASFETRFEDMVKEMTANGTVCNALVISGHHAGFYTGKRGTGKLQLSFLEKLSCNPKYASWFENVHGLWLQGCRTLKDGSIVQDNFARENARRVSLAHHGPDDTIATFSELELGFTWMMDPDNPLPHRVLMAFRNASVLGWNNSSPDEHQNSEMSMILHIAKSLEKKYKMENKRFTSNTKKQITGNKKLSSDVARDIALLLEKSLGREKEPMCMDALLDGWEEHWPWDKQNLPKSLKALSDSENNELTSTLIKARENNCILNLTNDTKTIFQTIREVLSDSRQLGYSFNNIAALLDRLASNYETKVYNEILSILLEPQYKKVLQEFISNRFRNPASGLIFKLKTLSIAKQYNLPIAASQSEANDIINILANRAFEDLIWEDSKIQEMDFTDYKAALMEELTTSQIPLTKEKILNLLKTVNLNRAILNKLAKNLHFIASNSKLKREDLKNILLSIVHHPSANDYTYVFVLGALVNNNSTNLDIFTQVFHPSEVYPILNAILSKNNVKINTAIASFNVLYKLQMLNKHSLPLVRKIQSFGIETKKLTNDEKKFFDKLPQFINILELRSK